MRLHLIVLPKPNSKSEVELARVNMLEAPNYDDYLFEGRAYYDTNEVSVSILTGCDGNLTKMLGGGGSMCMQGPMMNSHDSVNQQDHPM